MALRVRGSVRVGMNDGMNDGMEGSMPLEGLFWWTSQPSQLVKHSFLT